MIDGADLLAAWSDGRDADGNGYLDDLIGWDFVHNDNDPQDDSGHGTHGAGLTVQVAPNAEILPLKFLDSNGVGSLSDAIRALDYALSQGVSISSNGWAASTFAQDWSNELTKADEAGHLFVTAAGNGDPALLGILSRLQTGSVMLVAANDAEGHLAAFSNWESTIVDLAAPGVGLLSAMPGGGLAARSGTSVATAVVAGIAARLLGRHIEPTVTNVIDAILAAASPRQSVKASELPGSKPLALVAKSNAFSLTIAPVLPGSKSSNSPVSVGSGTVSFAALTDYGFEPLAQSVDEKAAQLADAFRRKLEPWLSGA
jgi:subtilisin family serine protease